MMTVLGYLAMVVVGISLGLIGGGGSILTLPILVYMFDVPPTLATGYSLFIVGASALVGAFRYGQQQLIDYRVGVIFAIPAFLGVYLARSFLVPALPDVIFSLGDWTMTNDGLIMMVFALVMLLASVSMIRRKPVGGDPEKEHKLTLGRYSLVGLEGLVVGGVTGFVGAGGGFLIIPALVFLTGLPIKRAIGTSLMIIAAKSLFGFTGDIQAGQPIDWGFLVAVTLTATIGIFVGAYLVRLVPSEKLKPAFGWFVLIMGGVILVMQTVQ
jgi:hypothetical protein